MNNKTIEWAIYYCGKVQIVPVPYEEFGRLMAKTGAIYEYCVKYLENNLEIVEDC